MVKALAYPFLPRSISHLRPGQFWAIPLSDGRFACGRVLFLPRSTDPGPSQYLNSRTGSEILGVRDLALDGVTGLQEVSHRGGGTAWLYEGGVRLRPATDDERQNLPVRSIWGRAFIQRLAEKHFVPRGGFGSTAAR